MISFVLVGKFCKQIKGVIISHLGVNIPILKDIFAYTQPYGSPFLIFTALPNGRNCVCYMPHCGMMSLLQSLVHCNGWCKFRPRWYIKPKKHLPFQHKVALIKSFSIHFPLVIIAQNTKINPFAQTESLVRFAVVLLAQKLNGFSYVWM